MSDTNSDITTLGEMAGNDFATIVEDVLVIHKLNGRDVSIKITKEDVDFVLDAMLTLIESGERQ